MKKNTAIAFIDSNLPKEVTKFLEAIKPFEEACKDGYFSYIAIKHGNEFFLVQGRLYLNAIKSETSSFQSDNILAGRLYLSELNLDVEGFIKQILTGSIKLPSGELIFPSRDKESYDSYYDPYHYDGLKVQQRYNTLTIRGIHSSKFIQQPAIDWELMSAETPYPNIQALAYDYTIGVLTSDNVSVEILTFPVAAMVDDSTVTETKANLCIDISNNLSPDKASIGYNIYNNNKVVTRGKINGSKLQWSKKEEHQQGTIEIEIPKASALHCFACYNGITQQQRWFADPSTFLNTQRAVYETFDSQLANIKAIIESSQEKGKDARDLEPAIACLFWMLGFKVVHIGGIPKMHQAPDIVANTNQGHFALIECTTGLLKADKLSLLYDRAEAVRRSLERSGNHTLNVLPIIVTSKTKVEINPDVGEAEKRGIYIMAREDLDDIINNRLLVPQNIEQLYNGALKAVQDSKAKFEKKSNFEN